MTSDGGETSVESGATAAPDPAGARPPIAVVGLGAVGSLLAGCLAAAGYPVVVVRRTPPDAGTTLLRVVGPGGARRTVSVEAVRPDAIPIACTVALLTVKQYDLAAAVEALASRPDLVLVTVQNGLGAEETVLAARPASGLVAASLTAAVEREPDGALRWLRRGGIGLAPVRGAVDAVIDELRVGFQAGGLPSHRYSDWAAMKWSKLLGNLVGNATSAILDLDPVAVYADPALFALERAQLLEALTVMNRLGLRPVGLPGAPIDWLARVLRLPTPVAWPVLWAVVGGARGGKSPSLRGHVAGSAAGPSEVAWLNGAVAERARALGLEAPVNRRLATLVEEVVADPARRAWFRGRPERLLAALADR